MQSPPAASAVLRQKAKSRARLRPNVTQDGFILSEPEMNLKQS